MTALLETERLRLRAFSRDDAGHLYELNADRDVMWFLTGGVPTPYEEVTDRVLPYFLGFYRKYGHTGLGYWAAESLASGQFLGWFHLRPQQDGSVDLGYRLRASAWNKGYATEGGLALVEWSFTRLEVPRVTARTMAVNHASRRVMDKCGLSLARSYHGDDDPAIPGAELGDVEYAVTRQEWLRRRAGEGASRLP